MKSRKDLDQAAQLIEVLAEDRRGDLALAWEALAERPSLAKAVHAALELLNKQHPKARRLLENECG